MVTQQISSSAAAAAATISGRSRREEHGAGELSAPVAAASRADLDGEARRAEAACPAHHQIAVACCLRRVVGHEPQHLLAEAARQRDERQDAEQHRRAQLSPLPLADRSSQLSTWRLIRLRSKIVSVPSQPARMASSSAQDLRPVRATRRAPSDRSS